MLPGGPVTIVMLRGGAERKSHNSAALPSTANKSATAVASHGLNPNVSINAVITWGRREGVGGCMAKREKSPLLYSQPQWMGKSFGWDLCSRTVSARRGRGPQQSAGLARISAG